MEQEKRKRWEVEVTRDQIDLVTIRADCAPGETPSLAVEEMIEAFIRRSFGMSKRIEIKVYKSED